MNTAHVKLLALLGLIALGALGCSDKQDETVHRERKTHSEPAPTPAPDAPTDVKPVEPAGPQP